MTKEGDQGALPSEVKLSLEERERGLGARESKRGSVSKEVSPLKEILRGEFLGVEGGG